VVIKGIHNRKKNEVIQLTILLLFLVKSEEWKREGAMLAKLLVAFFLLEWILVTGRKEGKGDGSIHSTRLISFFMTRD
jgi:hypothetical protein